MKRSEVFEVLKLWGIEYTSEQAADAIVQCDIRTAFHWGDDNALGQIFAEHATLEECKEIDFFVIAKGARNE